MVQVAITSGIMRKLGFRADWDASSSRKLTLQGDVYDAAINLNSTIPLLTAPTGYDTFADMIHSKGFNVLGRWDEKHSQDVSSTFQAYVDYQGPSYSQLQQEIYTFDFDYQTTWKANDRNDVEWGLGTRYIADNLTGSPSIIISNYSDSESVFSAFLQDQYALIQKEVYLTLGSKFEHNSFTGFEVEPSAHLLVSGQQANGVGGNFTAPLELPELVIEAIPLLMFYLSDRVP